nr:hypothetical protein [Asgard group archaeon]
MKNKEFSTRKVVVSSILLIIFLILPITNITAFKINDQFEYEDEIITNDPFIMDHKVRDVIEDFTTKEISVAVLNSPDTENPSYFYGGWSNNYVPIYDGLLANGISTIVITNAEIISGGLNDVDILIMIDNVPSETASPIVRDWCILGGSLLTFDSSICFNNWAGLLPPESYGVNGYGTYWTYSSPDEGTYVNYHPIMGGYTLGQTIFGTGGDSQYYSSAMLASSIGSYYYPVVKSDSNNDRDLIVVYDSPSQGSIIHIWDYKNWETTTNQILILNSINWLANKAVSIADLSIQIEAPTSLSKGETCLLNITVNNTGQYNFTDVELQLWINRNLVNTTIYPTVNITESKCMQYIWNPTLIGTNNITAYIVPGFNETYLFNNKISKNIIVSDPNKRIGFIYSHSEYLYGQANLINYYISLGFTVDMIYSTLTNYLVNQYSLLFVGESGTVWLDSEVTAIANFIASGGIFVSIGDSPPSDGAIKLGLDYGITFIGYSYGMSGITTNINHDNELMTGVNSIYIPGIFDALQLSSGAVEMFRDSSNLNIIGASVNIGQGLFCVLCDDFATVVDQEDNEIMFSNLIAYSTNSEVELLFPKGGEILSGTFNITWNSTIYTDTYLNYSVYLWDCHESLWVPLIENTNETSLEFLSTLYLDGTYYRIKVEATNGTYTSFAISGTFVINNYDEAPVVTLLYPLGGLTFDTYISISWSGFDPDLDSLTYSLYYRSSTGPLIEIALDLTSTNYFWSTSSIKNGNYYIRVVASDGTF